MTSDEILKVCNECNRVIDDPSVERALSAEPDAVPVNCHYYRFFYLLAQMLKPKTVVELGTCKGLGAMMFAKGNPEARVISIDRNMDALSDNIDCPNIEFKEQDSLAPLDVSDIDILFIDTSHDGIHSFAEYEHYLPKMEKNGLVFFDDVDLNDQMRIFWNKFDPGFLKLDLPVHGACGFGVVMVGVAK